MRLNLQIKTESFLVDASPPVIHGLTVPSGTRAKSVAIGFGVEDGPSGTGVASVVCGVRWLGLNPSANVTWSPCTPAEAPGSNGSSRRRRLHSAELAAQIAPLHSADGEALEARGTAAGPHPARSLLQATPGDSCASCDWFRIDLDTEEEGRWGVLVSVTDGANQTYTTPEAVMTVDRMAPNAWLAGKGLPRSPSPSTFQYVWDYTDTGRYESGENGALCLLVSADVGTLPDSTQAQSGADVVLPGTPAPAVPLDGDAGCAARVGGGCAELGVWQRCPSPAVYSGVETGAYVFRVKPVDAAGNAGAVMAAPTLTVDSSLSLDAAQRRGKKKKKKASAIATA